MSCIDIYAVVPNVETNLWSDVATLGLTLDKDDFLVSVYIVDEEQFLSILGLQSTPNSTRMKT